MATISFKIRKGKTQGSSIYLIFSYGRKKELRYSTGYAVKNIKNWNHDKQQVKNVLEESNASKINERLRDIHTFFANRYEELILSQGEITNDVLRHELDIFLGKKISKITSSTYKTLLECYKWYYEHYEKYPIPSTKKPLSAGTIKSYKSAFKVLEEFNKIEYPITYDKITMDFYYDFISYLEGRNFSNNYISNHIKMLKTIMNYSWEQKFHNNVIFKSKAFTKISEDVDSIYLNESELQAICKLELKGRRDNARDLFIIAAYTGLRVSDFTRLTKENIMQDGDIKYIEIKTKKTGKTVVIPINSIVQKILNKRDGNPPPKMPEQNINMLLKKIGEDAKINEKVRIEKTKGGKKTITEKDKFDLITNHTARRSFCTNAYKAGMATYDIMAISGHTSEKTFYRYIQISQLDALRKTAKHKFFN